MRARYRPLLFGGIVLIVLVVVAFALVLGNLARTPALYTGLKPTAALTPVPGNSQVPLTQPDGHYESILTDNGVSFVGSDNGSVYAFRTSDGTLLWHEATGDRADLYAVVNNALYTVSGTNSDTVDALRADTGAVIWQRRAQQGISPLAVADGVVYISARGQDASGPAIDAVRAGDGTPVWHYAPPTTFPVSISVADGMVYAHLRDGSPAGGSLSAIRASDGQVQWTYPVHAEFGTPTSANGVVYVVTQDGSVQAISSTTGHLLWRAALDRSIGPPPWAVAASGVIYATTRDRVYALRGDGSVLWQVARAQTPPPPDEPLVSGGVVYFREGLGGLVAVRAGDGGILWRADLDALIMGMTIADGRLDAITSLDAAAVRVADGAVLWRRSIAPLNTWGIFDPPYSVADGTVIVGNGRGHVQALRAIDGTVLWGYDIPPKGIVISQPVYTAAVTFDASVAYAPALRAVSDLGLQTFGSVCQPDWGPQGDATPWNHQLLVASTPLAPPGWLDPLGKIAGVTDVRASPVWHCPLLRPDNGLQHLPAGQAGIYVSVGFAARIDYDTALAVVDDLGFRLGNPCYENEPAGAQVQWTPMGQEQSFATTHRLLVVTTEANATAWRQQVESAPGVSGVDARIAPTCGARP